jgi:peptidyl-prolyl cis-trans isomerase SurA
MQLNSSPVRAEIADGIIAVVNTEIITYSDLKEFNHRLSKNSFLDERIVNTFDMEKVKKNKKDQLDYLITERLMDSEVKKQNLTVTMDKVEMQIGEVAQNNNISKADLYASLKTQGVNVSEYQAFIKQSLERQSLIANEVATKIKIPDEEIIDMFHKKHPQQKLSAYEYTLAHIFFNPKKGGLEAALQRAQNALEKIQSDSFDNVAEQYSEDPNFSSGGLLGTFKSGEFMKEMEDAISDLNASQFSEIIKSKQGYHIVKIIKKTVINDPLFEKEKEKIKNDLFESAFKKQFKMWIQTKREESYIQINQTLDN